MIAANVPALSHIFGWLHSLGGPGLILLGLLDSSVIPVPGSLDALTVVLSASQPHLWPYYAAMATVGSVVGAYLTYRLAVREGKETLERRVPNRTLKRVEQSFEKWGFWAITIPAVLPPPAPMVPFVLAAGAMEYPKKKFLASITLGRVVRFCGLAILAAFYGKAILKLIARHALPVVISVGIIAVAVAAFFIIRYFLRKRMHPNPHAPHAGA